FARLSVGTAANIWAIGMDNWVYYSTDGATSFFPIANMPVANYVPTTISATADGGVFVCNAAGELYTLVEHTSAGAEWTKVAGNIVEILAGSREFAWCWDTAEKCYLYRRSAQDSAMTMEPVVGNTPKSRGMDRVVAGVDGTTLGICANGTIMRWNGSVDSMD